MADVSPEAAGGSDDTLDIEVLEAEEAEEAETAPPARPVPAEPAGPAGPEAAKAPASPAEAPEADGVESPGADPSRDEFLKSLIDTDQEDVPKKVELDLDGIFNEAKKEAENLSPEATRLPEEAPAAEKPAAAPQPAPAPAADAKSKVVRVSRFKLGILVGLIAASLGGLVFGIYMIFFPKTPPAPVPPPPEIIRDDLAQTREKLPGTLPLDRFYITLGRDEAAVVVEMEIILHYQDDLVVSVIQDDIVRIRDLIFRLTRASSPSILTEMEERRQLQANLLTTLNNLDILHSDPQNPALSYVQISLLKKR
jgi:flagellar basal body-associated protein FliL